MKEEFRRVSIVGTSGSGKTTLARTLSRVMALPHYELDALNWLPDWKARPSEEFKKLVHEKIEQEKWVIEGNYSKIREDIWNKATHVIWLNMPFRIVFFRVVVRIFRRWMKKEVLWNGNRESFWKHFYTKDSMLYWVIKTHGKRKREYSTLFNAARFPHLKMIKLTGQEAINEFIASLEG